MEVVLAFAGAVAVFLLGMERVAEALEQVGPDRVEPALTRLSRTPGRGVVVGIAVTTLLDSSSAVIVLLIALVHARALSFRNALGIVLGANIGTTVGSQVIALDLGWLAPGMLVVGVAGRLVARAPDTRAALGVVQGIGLLFLGLELLDASVAPLHGAPEVLAWLERLEDPLQGAVAGALVTTVLQSSSATVGLAIGLAKAGVLSLPAGVAVMLGAEVGTCADTLVASVGRTRSALRVGLFHLAFNVVTVVVGLCAVDLLVAGAVGLAPGAAPARHLANAHVLFNVIGALACLPFVDAAADALVRLVPERGEVLGEGAAQPAG